MGIPILQGRALARQDTAMSLRVAVVNQQFARTFFGQGSPVDDLLQQRRQEHTIVGVCGDGCDRVSASMPPTFYRPFNNWRRISAR